ncbi:MAG: ABC transporter permease [Acidilobaceae archaeon]|nr:ABC transporter permease [Acidilobaceae archaeon]MCX8165514.1 ABC transporter permease [Acidilobaceae archaeon]MDW7973941.1 ABC transporter permease [Sulfolobales archaeon]
MISSILRSFGVARLLSAYLLRQPGWLIQDAMFAVAILIILYSWAGREGIAYAITGYISSGAFSFGINGVGQVVGWSRVMRTLDLYIASPITPRIFLLGAIIGEIPYFLTVSIVYALVGALIGQLWIVFFAIAVAFLISPLSILLGLSAAFYIKRPANLSAITNPIAFLGTMLPPVFYPVTTLPEFLRLPAMIIPTASGAELTRTLAGVSSEFDPLLLLSILLLWTLVAFLFANKVVKWSLD